MIDLYEHDINPNDLALEFLKLIADEVGKKAFFGGVTDADVCNAIVSEAKSLRDRMSHCDYCGERFFTDNDHIRQDLCPACAVYDDVEIY